MDVQVEGRPVSVASDATVADALREALSGKKFKVVVAARIPDAADAGQGTERAGRLLDLSAPIPAGCAALEPVYADSPDGGRREKALPRGPRHHRAGHRLRLLLRF